jgi:uncharacterized protein YggU (UPF0235/DUF167 family)
VIYAYVVRLEEQTTKMTQTPERTLIKVTIGIRSASFKIEQEQSNLLVHCKNPPEKGKLTRN